MIGESKGAANPPLHHGRGQLCSYSKMVKFPGLRFPLMSQGVLMLAEAEVTREEDKVVRSGTGTLGTPPTGKG